MIFHSGGSLVWKRRAVRHRSEKSGICGKYPQGKPGSVFNSQRWCGEYSPESE